MTTKAQIIEKIASFRRSQLYELRPINSTTPKSVEERAFELGKFHEKLSQFLAKLQDDIDSLEP